MHTVPRSGALGEDGEGLQDKFGCSDSLILHHFYSLSTRSCYNMLQYDPIFSNTQIPWICIAIRLPPIPFQPCLQVSPQCFKVCPAVSLKSYGSWIVYNVYILKMVEKASSKAGTWEVQYSSSISELAAFREESARWSRHCFCTLVSSCCTAWGGDSCERWEANWAASLPRGKDQITSTLHLLQLEICRNACCIFLDVKCKGLRFKTKSHL